MMRKKIIWGICGIGHGHIYRQLPLIEAVKDRADILIFAYGTSYDFFKDYCADEDNIRVVNVAVPYFVGDKSGLSFDKSARHNANKDINFFDINTKAMAYAQRQIGKADLVISDYEPVCAHYAYAFDIPLITYDQQSKLLTGLFDENINGFSNRDEVQRLRMFFPRAEKRVASSFFNAPKQPNNISDVVIVPPTMRDAIAKQKNKTTREKHIVIYVSAQMVGTVNVKDLLSLCQKQAPYDFHVFGMEDGSSSYENIHIHPRGNNSFAYLLASSSGVISTAGHGLLSEAMYLHKPVLAMPLPLYEQQLNAHMIDTHHFGLMRQNPKKTDITEFISHLDDYHQAIKNDHQILMQNSDTTSTTLKNIIFDGLI